MRITFEQKNATRLRIVEAALELFRTRGFDATTTRDIARLAGIATGTLFNYFDSKEAIIGHLAEEAIGLARSGQNNGTTDGTLEEELFALVAAQLRQLKPLRKFITPFLETALSPLVSAPHTARDGSLRVEH